MHKDHQILSSRALGVALLTLGLLVVTSPAMAGFQWVAPSTPDVEPPLASAPFTEPALPSSPNHVIEAQTPLPPVKGLDQKTAASPSAQKPVLGFADNIPLSVALRQVLPQEIGFSMAKEVSLGTLVSWKGGQPWNKVLTDMLTPVGLSYEERGQLVHIVRGASGAVPASFGTLPSLPPAPPAPLPSVSAEAGKPVALTSSSALPPVAPLPSPSVAAPVADATAPMQNKNFDTWSANKGDTLQRVFEEWCKRAGAEMNWQAEYDYPLQASVTFTGSFEEAVRGLLLGFQDASPQPVGFLYNSATAGQPVLVIQVRGNKYKQ